MIDHAVFHISGTCKRSGYCKYYRDRLVEKFLCCRIFFALLRLDEEKYFLEKQLILRKLTGRTRRAHHENLCVRKRLRTNPVSLNTLNAP